MMFFFFAMNQAGHVLIHILPRNTKKNYKEFKHGLIGDDIVHTFMYMYFCVRLMVAHGVRFFVCMYEYRVETLQDAYKKLAKTPATGGSNGEL